MREIILIVHNIRSAHNVGSLLRTADGLGVSKVYLSGYTPYPIHAGDERLPHLAAKVDKQIAKTSLGAEKSVTWEHVETLSPVISRLKDEGWEVAALEQAASSVRLDQYQAPAKVAVILGSEVGGIDKNIIELADVILEIPMLGKKESFNVAVSAAMALYQLRYFSTQ